MASKRIQKELQARTAVVFLAFRQLRRAARRIRSYCLDLGPIG